MAGHTVYVLKQDVSHLEYLVPHYKLETELEQFVKDWATIGPTDKAHVVTYIVRVGLVNFVRTAGRRLDAFSYAFTPSEPDELVATHSLDEQSRMLGAQATANLAGRQATGGATVSQHLGAEQSRNASRKLIVAFGEQFNSAIATFGWVIQPQEPIEGTDDYRQRASQTSLAALISLPAWSMRVKSDAPGRRSPVSLKRRLDRIRSTRLNSLSTSRQSMQVCLRRTTAARSSMNGRPDL